MSKLAYFVTINDYGFSSLTKGDLPQEFVQKKRSQAKGPHGDEPCPPDKIYFAGYCSQCCLMRKHIGVLKNQCENEAKFVEETFSLLIAADTKRNVSRLMMLHTKAKIQFPDDDSNALLQPIARIPPQMLRNVCKYI